MLRKKFAALLIATVAVFSAVLVPAAAASAKTVAPATVTCSSSPSDANCDGHWPDIDACTGDATTVSSTNVNGAYLELRWSNGCKSNWARVSLSGNNAQVWVERSDGLKEYSSWNYVNGQEWSPMVYAPVLAARACVSYHVWLSTYTGCTDWV